MNELRLSAVIHDQQEFTLRIHAGQQITIIDDVSASVTLILERDAVVQYRYSMMPIAIRRSLLTMQLVGAGAEIAVSAVGWLSDDQQWEIVTRQEHQAPHTKSRVTVRLVHADRASSIYQGAITIAAQASESEAFQDHKALLIDTGAHAYARPTLEAQTNDIQCGHGSAIGYLDQEQLWYLQSRGIDLDRAQTILVAAFLSQ